MYIEDPCQFVQIYQVKKKYLLPALKEIVYLLNVTCLCRKVDVIKCILLFLCAIPLFFSALKRYRPATP